MLNLSKKTIFTLTLALLLNNTFASESITIETAKGNIDVPKNPQKVAVFNLGILENLQALGIKAGAVINKLPTKEQQQTYKDTPRIGTLHQPNIEKLITYQPDLIILTTRSAKHADTLKDIAPTIDMSPTGNTMIANTKKHFSELAKIFEKQESADEIIARLDTKVATVKALSKTSGKALVVLSTGPKIAAFSKDSRFGWLHSELGIPQAVDNLKQSTHGQPISFEFIKEANPEWLIIIDRGAAIGKNVDSAQTVFDNALVADTVAWKKGQVIYIDPIAIYLAAGGVIGIEQTLDTFITAFQQAQQ